MILSAKLRRRKSTTVVVVLLTVFFIVYFATSKTFIFSSLPGARHLINHPRKWPYPTSGGKVIVKNGSSRVTLPAVPYNEKYPTRKALVLASYSMQNIDWLDEMRSDWEIFRYVLDDPNPRDGGLTVPRNQGREVMVYLTYIIDNYHNLPNFTVFHHGHRRAWHQPEPTPMKVRALNLSALSTDHYINLRCALNPGCTDDTVISVSNPKRNDPRVHARIIPTFWNLMFGGDSPWDFGPPPYAVSVPCCAQFAVTREAILAHPLEFWKFYRRPLERDLTEYQDMFGAQSTGYFLGMCYEKFWHIIFGQATVHCPSEEYCRKTQFSDAVVCERYTGGVEDLKGWEDIRCINRYQDD